MLFVIRKHLMKIMIRRATSDDISTIAALHKVALHKHWSHDSVEHFLTAPTGDIWVAEQEDTLIGFITVSYTHLTLPTKA